jgi:hypothetical protein
MHNIFHSPSNVLDLLHDLHHKLVSDEKHNEVQNLQKKLLIRDKVRSLLKAYKFAYLKMKKIFVNQLYPFVPINLKID